MGTISFIGSEAAVYGRSDKKEHRFTDLKKGHAAIWAHWQPPAAP
jgi:hypothetical protein